MGAAETQVRADSGTVIGLDMPAVLQIAGSFGYDADELLPLLTRAEAGMLSGIHKRRQEWREAT